MSADNDSLLVQDIIDDEYSTNFFQFTAKEVHSGVMKTIIPGAIAESIEHLKKCLMTNCKGYENQIESACEVLLKESSSAIPVASVPLKVLSDSNFKIPKHVLLDQDLIQRVQYDEEDVNRIDGELVALENRITKACFMESFLEQELELVSKFEEVVDITKTLSLTSELANSCSDGSAMLKLPKLVKHINSTEEERKKCIQLPASCETGIEAAEKKMHEEIFTG